GNALDGDADGSAGGERAADEFFRLFGDVNGDRVVGALDAFQLRQALSVYNDDLDIDNDGLISVHDISQFRNRLGTSL
ncbi:MAG: dockerin type I domain-containing protein, partial [Pirellulales bacterium]|nr:dockerin type I domain-containing protein [Pirellulales bacterium]